jgi:hypothetical protein
MSLIRKSYGKLSSVEIETKKGMAAGLRTGVEKATGGDANILNTKMKSLIEFDKVLDNTINRMANSDLFSLKGVVIGGIAAGAGHPAAALTGLANVGLMSGLKSAIGIVTNELSKVSSKTGVPIQILFEKAMEMVENSEKNK